MYVGTVPLQSPPRVKVLEALGAVAGGRVRLLSDKQAEVDASEGRRTYRVYVDVENHVAESDDNGTVFRNYVGYPIIAVLMAAKILPYYEEIAKPLAGVRWRSLNERYKSYRVVESLVKKKLAEHGIRSDKVDEAITAVLSMLEQLKLAKPST
ncbi:MAG: hypothetical protein QXI02_01795 [Candidatus Caldarchaeum sp.]